MIVSSLDVVLVIIASLGAALVAGGVMQLIFPGASAFYAALAGMGLPPVVALAWHLRVMADKEAAYVRQTDAATAAKWAAIEKPASPVLPDLDAKTRALREEQGLFFRAGLAAKGFSIRKLKGVIGSKKWEVWTHFYANPQGREVLTLVEGNDGYQLSPGWTEEKIMTAVRGGALPHPDGELAGIQPYVGNATRQNARQQAATAAETV